MVNPPNIENEAERLRELDSYSILDTFPEEDFDNITALASEICGTPISLVSLVDEKRQWFKSHHGTDLEETPREHAFCAHAIAEPDDIFVVEDARTDERFYDNPLVTENPPNIRFYAGVPLKGPSGNALGSLCVIDNEPRELNTRQLKSLRALSQQVMRLMELRKNKAELERALDAQKEVNKQLERFASIAAHDIKSPLNNISGFAGLLGESYGEELDDDGREMLKAISTSADRLKALVDGLLQHSRSEKLIQSEKITLNLTDFFEDISGLFHSERKDLDLNLQTKLESITVNKVVLQQILINLISNAIKYNDKDRIRIDLTVDELQDHYRFELQDNGRGIAQENQEKIFNIFEIGEQKDRFGESGTGIGLATVKKMVEASGGDIHLESDLGKGSRFIFTLKK